MQRRITLYADPQLDQAVSYIHGRIEAQIEAFADSLEVPKAELTRRLGALLLGTESREPLGTHHSVPTLPKPSTKRRKTVAKVAVASSTRGGTQVTSTRKTSAAGVRAYWAKMTPEARAKEMQRRARVAKAKRKVRKAMEAAT